MQPKYTITDIKIHVNSLIKDKLTPNKPSQIKIPAVIIMQEISGKTISKKHSLNAVCFFISKIAVKEATKYPKVLAIASP